MRILALPLTMACCVCIAELASAQQVGASMTADQKGIGQLQTRIEKYDTALGVISQFARQQLANVECNGVCYFPNSSKPIAWKCEPGKKCDLHCTVNPPVGGCD
jgi:hypothetical protein